MTAVKVFAGSAMAGADDGAELAHTAMSPTGAYRRREQERDMSMSRYERESSGAGFAAGALTGALVGAGLALLLAPKAGAELREELGESLTSLRERRGASLP